MSHNSTVKRLECAHSLPRAIAQLCPADDEAIRLALCVGALRCHNRVRRMLLLQCSPLCQPVLVTLLGLSILTVLLLLQRLYKRLECRHSSYLFTLSKNFKVCSSGYELISLS